MSILSTVTSAHGSNGEGSGIEGVTVYKNRKWSLGGTVDYRRVDPILDNLEYRGCYPSCRYTYIEPTTSPSSLFQDFLETGVIDREIRTVPSEDLSFKRYKPPTLDDIKQHLSRFADARPFDSETFRGVSSHLEERLSAIEGRAHQRVLVKDWLLPENVALVKTESDTSAGIRWSRLGLKKKKEAIFPAAVMAAEVIKSYIREGKPYRAPPNKVAGRGKVVDIRKEGAKKDGRLILVPDMERHLLGSITSKVYTQMNKDVRKDDGGTLIGMGPFGSWYDYLATVAGTPGTIGYLMVDYSGFDQTVSSELIQWSLDHVRGYFEEVQGANAYWASEYDNLVNTDIALPDGRVFRKNRGVGSGDPWTSQVDSLANWAATTWALDTLGVKARVWTFGDDVLVAVDSLPEDVPNLKDLSGAFSRTVKRLAGLETKPTATYVSELLVIHGKEPVENMSPSFLSAYFMSRMDSVMPVKLTEDMFQGLSYPERNYEKHGDGTYNYEWELARVSAYYLIYYWNYQARDVISLYHDYLLDRIRLEGRLIEMSNLDDSLMKLLDIPLGSFLLEWSVRLPTVTEIIQLYVDGVIVNFAGTPVDGGSSSWGGSGPPSPLRMMHPDDGG
jgi:hypothetical protein